MPAQKLSDEGFLDVAPLRLETRSPVRNARVLSDDSRIGTEVILTNLGGVFHREGCAVLNWEATV